MLDDGVNICLFNNVFANEQLEEIKNTIWDLFISKKMLQENNPYLANSVGGGYNLPVTLLNLEHLIEKVKKNYGSNYLFSHSFCRIYFNQSKLNIHVDRPGLDLTGTLTVYKNYNNPWPIYFSSKEFLEEKWNENTPAENYKKDFKVIDVDANQMAVCRGTRVPHWRDNLNCGPDQYSIHVFYHWKLYPGRCN